MNPGPLGHESSALTTRPQLLAEGLNIYMSTLNNTYRLINVSKVNKSLFGMENLL